MAQPVKCLSLSHNHESLSLDPPHPCSSWISRGVSATLAVAVAVETGSPELESELALAI